MAGIGVAQTTCNALQNSNRPLHYGARILFGGIGIFRQKPTHLTILGAGELGEECIWRAAVGFWVWSSA